MNENRRFGLRVGGAVTINRQQNLSHVNCVVRNTWWLTFMLFLTQWCTGGPCHEAK